MKLVAVFFLGLLIVCCSAHEGEHGPDVPVGSDGGGSDGGKSSDGGGSGKSGGESLDELRKKAEALKAKQKGEPAPEGGDGEEPAEDGKSPGKSEGKGKGKGKSLDELKKEAAERKKAAGLDGGEDKPAEGGDSAPKEGGDKPPPKEGGDKPAPKDGGEAPKPPKDPKEMSLDELKAYADELKNAAGV